MCLKVGLEDKPKIAKSDIICYKLVRKPANTDKYFYTVYRDSKVSVGKKYKSRISFHNNYYHKFIDRGLHTITNLKDVKKLKTAEYKTYNYDFVIIKCIIPKGSNYFVGRFVKHDRFRSYASNCLYYQEII